MIDWLKAEVERQEKEKLARLEEKGMKPYYEIKPVPTKNFVNIDMEKGFSMQKNTFNGIDYVWTLLDPLGYELRAKSSLHRAIIKELQQFLLLDLARRPPLVRFEITYDPSASLRKRYGAKLA